MITETKELAIKKIEELQEIYQNKDLRALSFEKSIKPIFASLLSIPDLPDPVFTNLKGAMAKFEYIDNKCQIMIDELEEFRRQISAYLYDAKSFIRNSIEL